MANNRMRIPIEQPGELAEAARIISKLLPFAEWCVDFRRMADVPTITRDDVDAARSFLKRQEQ